MAEPGQAESRSPGEGGAVGNPVVICLSSGQDREELTPLIAGLRRTGREVLVATRPIADHLSGRTHVGLQRLSARLGGSRVHLLSVGPCCCEAYDTISALDGLASVILIDPRLPDCEPSHPGRRRVPKLVVEKEKHPTPQRFLGNTLGPVEVKKLPAEADEELPQVVMEFIDRTEQGSPPAGGST